ncbi:hypothetical protein Q31a_45880 [Aureliella helgolandensis]|uniref:Uncharacterized protein n=1 Tax=Aureliella helgolandensis TaxID=2527968 RepID=A0A518GC87_9BACT|nr:hypothetical protein Q31a_45880 [Aureliella helgolandensis]
MPPSPLERHVFLFAIRSPLLNVRPAQRTTGSTYKLPRLGPNGRGSTALACNAPIELGNALGTRQIVFLQPLLEFTDRKELDSRTELIEHLSGQRRA